MIFICTQANDPLHIHQNSVHIWFIPTRFLHFQAYAAILLEGDISSHMNDDECPVREKSLFVYTTASFYPCQYSR